jgi:hypothetical protein
LDDVAFRQLAVGEMLVNSAGALALLINSANAVFFNFQKNTKLSLIKVVQQLESTLFSESAHISHGPSIEPLPPRYVGRISRAPR